jgi:outer membrane protein OmpA-like peptidoglycan-associated protein
MIAAWACLPVARYGAWLGSVAILALTLGPPAQADEAANTAGASEAGVERPLDPSASASELQDAIDSIKRRLAAQQDNRASTASSELVAELRSARETIAELSQNLARLRDERDSLQVEVVSARQASAAASAALDEATEEAAAAQEALVAARESAEADRAARVAALEESQQSLDALAEQNAFLEAELGSERDLRRTLAIDLEALEKEKRTTDDALQAALDEVETLQAALTEARDGLTARDAELAAATAAIAELEARLTDADSAVETATLALDQRVAELEAARLEVERQLEAAETEEREMAAELAASAAAQRERERQLEELRAVASQSVSEIETLGETLLVTLAENEELVTALAEARGSRALIENELKAMRQDLEAYAATTTGPVVAEAETEEEFPLALVASDAVVEVLDAELAEANAQIASLTEELIARDKQLASARADGDVDALSQQIGLLEQTVEVLSAENATMADQLEALQAEAELIAPELITASLAPDEAVEHFLGQLNAVDTGDGWWMTVPEGLVFAPGSDVLATGTEPVIAQIAALIGYFGDAPVRIVGHTDSFGDAEVNRQLSLQRANAVGQRLVDSFAVDGTRIVTEGFGEERPIASNATIEGRRANRRVEVYIKR